MCSNKDIKIYGWTEFGIGLILGFILGVIIVGQYEMGNSFNSGILLGVFICLLVFSMIGAMREDLKIDKLLLKRWRD